MKSGIIRLKDKEIYEKNKSYPDVYMAPINEEFDFKKWRVAVNYLLKTIMLKNFHFNIKIVY